MRSNVAALALFLGVFSTLSAPAPALAKDAPIPIKVVIVTMFEAGADTGDTPGELGTVGWNAITSTRSFPSLRPTTTCASIATESWPC